ncbi:hypothetical protein C8J57DRAFT_1465745 [Mycena rebaudengoi]|nr:hypothetical protein C8J57DRAFT_1465745 [Mycena rebaudengoi]
MKFSTAFFALIPFVAAKTPGNVRICTDAGFTGNCITLNGGSTQCNNFPGSFNDNISSFGPDDGQDCFIFVFLSSDAGCTGAQAGPIRFPGISNLNDIGFNDKISSWKLVLLRVKGVLVRERALPGPRPSRVTWQPFANHVDTDLPLKVTESSVVQRLIRDREKDRKSQKCGHRECPLESNRVITKVAKKSALKMGVTITSTQCGESEPHPNIWTSTPGRSTPNVDV